MIVVIGRLVAGIHGKLSEITATLIIEEGGASGEVGIDHAPQHRGSETQGIPMLATATFHEAAGVGVATGVHGDAALEPVRLLEALHRGPRRKVAADHEAPIDHKALLAVTRSHQIDEARENDHDHLLRTKIDVARAGVSIEAVDMPLVSLALRPLIADPLRPSGGDTPHPEADRQSAERGIPKVFPPQDLGALLGLAAATEAAATNEPPRVIEVGHRPGGQSQDVNEVFRQQAQIVGEEGVRTAADRINSRGGSANRTAVDAGTVLQTLHFREHVANQLMFLKMNPAPYPRRSPMLLLQKAMKRWVAPSRWEVGRASISHGH